MRGIWLGNLIEQSESHAKPWCFLWRLAMVQEALAGRLPQQELLGGCLWYGCPETMVITSLTTPSPRYNSLQAIVSRQGGSWLRQTALGSKRLELAQAAGFPSQKWRLEARSYYLQTPLIPTDSSKQPCCNRGQTTAPVEGSAIYKWLSGWWSMANPTTVAKPCAALDYELEMVCHFHSNHAMVSAAPGYQICSP